MWWRIEPLLSGDSVNISRCLVAAGKHVNNTRVIARQLLCKRIPAATDMLATVEMFLDYNENGVFCWVRPEAI
jgi:hypothetical protein